MMFWCVMLGFILGTMFGFAMAVVLLSREMRRKPPPRPSGNVATFTAAGPIEAGQMCCQLPNGTVKAIERGAK